VPLDHPLIGGEVMCCVESMARPRGSLGYVKRLALKTRVFETGLSLHYRTHDQAAPQLDGIELYISSQIVLVWRTELTISSIDKELKCRH
jgi:hypothetical protein